MKRSRPGFATVTIDDSKQVAEATPAAPLAPDMRPAIARHTTAQPSSPKSPLTQTRPPDYKRYEGLMQAKADAAFARMQAEVAAKKSTELLPTSEPSAPPITTNPQPDESKPYRPFALDETT